MKMNIQYEDKERLASVYTMYSHSPMAEQAIRYAFQACYQPTIIIQDACQEKVEFKFIIYKKNPSKDRRMLRWESKVINVWRTKIGNPIVGCQINDLYIE